MQKAAHAMQSGQYHPVTATMGQSEDRLQKAMLYSLQGVPDIAVSMFLDAACVLCGCTEADMLAAWQQWHGEDADSLLELLKSRHLLATDDEGRVQVHDVLRWFGRMVELGNISMNPALHSSRLWVQDNKVVGHIQVCLKLL